MYTVKLVDGRLYACDQNFKPGDEVFETRLHDDLYMVKGMVKIRQIPKLLKGVYERPYKTNPDGSPRVLIATALDKDHRYGFEADSTFRIVQELPEGCSVEPEKKLSQAELDHIMCPYPLVIQQLAEVLKGCGDVWRDDSGDTHLDDIDPFKAASAVYEALESHKIDFVNKQLIPYE